MTYRHFFLLEIGVVNMLINARRTLADWVELQISRHNLAKFVVSLLGIGPANMAHLEIPRFDLKTIRKITDGNNNGFFSSFFF